ncbi:hypothetical protein MRX96_046995 [Rhipicephalus microplus]
MDASSGSSKRSSGFIEHDGRASSPRKMSGSASPNRLAALSQRGKYYQGYVYAPAVPLTTCVGNPTMVFGQPGPVSIVTVFSSWGPHPVAVSCPYCEAFVTTRLCPQPGLLTWLVCSGMAMLGCVPCCFLPFCVYECQDVEHFCPNCRRILGVYRRI